MFDGSREDFTKVSTNIYILAGTSSQACGKMLQCKHFTVLHHRWLGESNCAGKMLEKVEVPKKFTELLGACFVMTWHTSDSPCFL